MIDIPKPNPNFRRMIICSYCEQEKELHAKGVCFNCYRRYAWKKPIAKCNNCGRERPHHAKGYCNSCYMKVFFYHRIKSHNLRKYHKIPMDLYDKITKKCFVCGFDKIINLHHLDHNKNNNSESNMVGLCPNHHKMIHDHRYSQEVADVLILQGYSPKVKKF